MCGLNQDLKTVYVGDGSYNICVNYSWMKLITGNTKIYKWPMEVKVAGGKLVRINIGGSVTYTFIKDINKTVEERKKEVSGKGGKNGNGNGITNWIDQINSDPWIHGIDNTTLILIGAGLLIVLRN
jgi:hypothetical protein